MIRLGKWTVLLFLLPLLAVCSRPPQAVTVTEQDAGNQIELEEGDTLEVRLEGIPGTGFTWEVEAGELAILRQEGEAEFESDSELVGAPATIVLRFTAIKAGEEALRLVYHRPWEEDVAPESSFEATIVVQ
jgi:inhibitor of cysteine peptidase